MQVKIDDIRRVTNAALERIIRGGIHSIDISENLYWMIEPSERFYLENRPSDLSVGSLVDEYNFLKPAIDGEREVLSVDLLKLAVLIEYIGEKASMELAAHGG